MKISDYIRDLLLFHEKLILPGLGAFEIHRKPAVFGDHKVFPPQSIIAFNPVISADDNVLASKMSEAEDIEHAQAVQQIRAYIENIKSKLDNGEQFVVEGLGILYLDENNKYVFLKNEKLIIDYETTGFESFELDPLEDIPTKENEDLDKKNKIIKEIADKVKAEINNLDYTAEEKKSNRGFLWILAGSIVIILISFIILSLTTDLFENLDTGLFKTHKKQTTRVPENIFGGKDDFERSMESAIDSLTKLENALRINESITTPESTVTSVYTEFHIIAGSFSVMKNANELQIELSFLGYPSVILNRGDGFYRVSAISFPDKEEALTALETFRNTTPYKSSWVLGLN